MPNKRQSATIEINGKDSKTARPPISGRYVSPIGRLQLSSPLRDTQSGWKIVGSSVKRTETAGTKAKSASRGTEVENPYAMSSEKTFAVLRKVNVLTAAGKLKKAFK
ncbi:hypothetical protein CR159_17645 [Pollutimonas subterranea]|uniref:Uncharacterized protein n=1 Tax=Pollutimonas subterranea TaxID=2045210 RepID=A0A2N4U0H0_9BURK|nr:hypothetical protein CR159_17645 [Pollutimonas subterranea]